MKGSYSQLEHFALQFTIAVSINQFFRLAFLSRLSKEIEKAQSSVSSIEALSADAKTTLKGQNTKVLQEQQGAVLDSNKASSTFRRFQPPVKPPNQSTSKDKSPVSKDNSMSSSYFPDDVDDEFERNSEELACLAAAEEISQEIRELNPAKASRSTFSFNRGDTYPGNLYCVFDERIY